MAKHHPNKEISKAIELAISQGWRFTKSKKGHAYGSLLCHHGGRDGCRVPVYSTPKNPEGHSRWILGRVSGCPHQIEFED